MSLNGTAIQNTNVLTTAKVNRALMFNGTGDYATIAYNSALNPNYISVSVWVKFNVVGLDYEMIFVGGGSDTYELRIGPGTYVEWICYDSGGYKVGGSDSTISAGVWYHIVGIYNGSTCFIYLNGVAQTTTAVSGAMVTSSNDNYIGARNLAAYPLNGIVDDIRIYNVAISQTVVDAIYNSGAGTESEDGSLGTNLVAHYKMNDNAASTTVADSVNSYNGTAYRNTNLMTSSKVNGALSFNGSTDQIDIANSSLFNFGTGDFTISIWVKATSVPSYAGLFNNGYDPYGAIIYFKHEGFGGAMAAFGPYPDIKITTSVNPAVDEWHLVVLERNGNTGEFYIDDMATAIGTADLTGYTYPTLAGATVIGQDGFGNRFVGMMDDFRVYNRALTQTERTQLYNGGNGTEQQ